MWLCSRYLVEAWRAKFSAERGESHFPVLPKRELHAGELCEKLLRYPRLATPLCQGI
jgi:hypothetical protein